MKKILLSIGLVLAASFVMAQCSTTLASGLKIKSVDGEHMNGGDQLWICAGVTYEVSGDGNNVWVEKGANITISGEDNRIYIKGPGTIDITGGASMPNNTTYEKNVTYTDVMGNTSNDCDSIEVDYDNAPSTGGCDIYAGIENNITQLQIRMYPNPANDVLHIEHDGNVSLVAYQVYGVNGQVVLSGQMDNTDKIDVSTLEGGLYVFRVQTSKGEISERITIE